MEVQMDNDTRGWIMTALSGIACLLGAALIGVDIIVRMFPGKKNFRIENSNGFLSASLSLSFGVMVFSALAKMMPSSKKALMDGGFSKKETAFAQIGLFLVGALGIQFLSRAMHHFIPSHIVDCDHTHDEDDSSDELESCPDEEEAQVEGVSKPHSLKSNASLQPRSLSTPGTLQDGTTIMKTQWSALPDVLTTKKARCDDEGRCYGYSDPCSVNCFRKLQAGKDGTTWTRPGMIRSATTSEALTPRPDETTPLIKSTSGQANGTMSSRHHRGASPSASSSSTLSKIASRSHAHNHKRRHNHTNGHIHNHDQLDQVENEDDHTLPNTHHHHVPTNAFLSLGLQTSLAIALHKLPEGFITYATNHANPQLGVTVFLSLFIHNITEGFALALPLYLALKSRPKAMFWSAILGGLSQPVGAGIAALWFHVAGAGKWAPGQAMYGGMFAIVAGIMANVGMQLMGEAWALGHDRNLCILFAFIGMGILGFASALTK